MKKRIAIGADGSWNLPQQEVDADTATTVLRPVEHGQGDVVLHRQVELRSQADSAYRPDKLLRYVGSRGWPAKLQR